MDDELQKTLIKLKDTNALIDPVDIVRLIEEVGMWIDDLDLEIIELEQNVNIFWDNLNKSCPGYTKTEVTNQVKLSGDYKIFKERTALLKRLRRHYRLLNTKLNLLTKPKGR